MEQLILNVKIKKKENLIFTHKTKFCQALTQEQFLLNIWLHTRLNFTVTSNSEVKIFKEFIVLHN